MKKIVLTAAARLHATPALADFWILREGSGPCRVEDVEPSDTKIVVGNKV